MSVMNLLPDPLKGKKEKGDEDIPLVTSNPVESISEGAESIVTEVQTTPLDKGTVEWIFDPEDILKKFELFLRGYYYDFLSDPPGYRKVYKYKRDENGKLVKYHYRLANDLGVNDVMSTLTLYINKVFSFSWSEKDKVERELNEMCYDLYDRYIVDKGKEFSMRPADAYIIVNDMYNIIHSAWSQGFKGFAFKGFTTSTNRQEIINPAKANERKPFWMAFRR